MISQQVGFINLRFSVQSQISMGWQAGPKAMKTKAGLLVLKGNESHLLPTHKFGVSRQYYTQVTYWRDSCDISAKASSM